VELQTDGAGGHVERALVHVLVAGHGRVARKPARPRPPRSAVHALAAATHTAVAVIVEPVILRRACCHPGCPSRTAQCRRARRRHRMLCRRGATRGTSLAAPVGLAPWALLRARAGRLSSVRVGPACQLRPGCRGWSGQQGSRAGGHHSVSDSTAACGASPRRLRDDVAGEDRGGPPGATLQRGAARWSAAAGRAGAQPKRARGSQVPRRCQHARRAERPSRPDMATLWRWHWQGAAGRRGRSRCRRPRMPGALRAGGRARAVRLRRREAHASALQAVRAALEHLLRRHARLRARAGTLSLSHPVHMALWMYMRSAVALSCRRLARAPRRCACVYQM